ncbi:MAG TPA: lysophospholipid acyltransferase family protein [Thauera sp.]|uniref:lysophospholipid acyltransferase family protein n=1 Tax=Thauera sp. TaxID=1905334 RepID=UPI002608A468|nr:lysophospholipid acyltransferase family protein [Thauera sp.]MCP5225462.1 1-acyl-sn-glycerol-3-phosphate acyltransferase [Thauera sp.]HRV76857.1 lysophospholipid acyltransferase family protein [Thauera sp.]
MHAGADTAPPPSSTTTPAVEAGVGAARAGAMLRATRWTRLGLHLLQGVLTIAAVYPFTGRDTHQALRRRWSLGLLRVLGMRLEHRGEAVAPGCMLVANHVSWVDIFAINALAPAAFVSKAEVRAWPVIGWLAAKNDTIFLRRGSRGHARIINEETAALLDAGCNVAIFPEGTTTDGAALLHFHAALLQPAIACGHPVQPLALQYRTPDDRFSRTPAYDGELSLGECIANIIAAPRTVARITVAAPITTADGADRRTLATRTRAEIATVIGITLDAQD